jgi:hypothetical protein
MELERDPEIEYVWKAFRHNKGLNTKWLIGEYPTMDQAIEAANRICAPATSISYEPGEDEFELSEAEVKAVREGVAKDIRIN